MNDVSPKRLPATKAIDRLDATTKAAQSIIDRETGERDKKTARLKAARLANEAAAEPESDPKS